MSLLSFERAAVAACSAGDREHAMAGAGECAQRIDDLPKTADMVQKVMADAEKIIAALAGTYIK
jgi:hypothetical protein